MQPVDNDLGTHQSQIHCTMFDGSGSVNARTHWQPWPRTATQAYVPMSRTASVVWSEDPGIYRNAHMWGDGTDRTARA